MLVQRALRALLIRALLTHALGHFSAFGKPALRAILIRALLTHALGHFSVFGKLGLIFCLTTQTVARASQLHGASAQVLTTSAIQGASKLTDKSRIWSKVLAPRGL